MLTRKQSWRRSCSKGSIVRRDAHHDFLYNEGLNDYEDVIPSRRSSEPTFANKYDSGFLYRNSAHSTTCGDLSKSKSHQSMCECVHDPSNQYFDGNDCHTCNLPQKPIPSKTKRVKWQLSVRVVLIPTREEYVNAGLANLIWWTESDYLLFRDSAALELKRMVERMKIDVKDAIKYLYQPGYHANNLSASSLTGSMYQQPNHHPHLQSNSKNNHQHPYHLQLHTTMEEESYYEKQMELFETDILDEDEEDNNNNNKMYNDNNDSYNYGYSYEGANGKNQVLHDGDESCHSDYSSALATQCKSTTASTHHNNMNNNSFNTLCAYSNIHHNHQQTPRISVESTTATFVAFPHVSSCEHTAAASTSTSTKTTMVKTSSTLIKEINNQQLKINTNNNKRDEGEELIITNVSSKQSHSASSNDVSPKDSLKMKHYDYHHITTTPASSLSAAYNPTVTAATSAALDGSNNTSSIHSNNSTNESEHSYQRIIRHPMSKEVAVNDVKRHLLETSKFVVQNIVPSFLSPRVSHSQSQPQSHQQHQSQVSNSRGRSEERNRKNNSTSSVIIDNNSNNHNNINSNNNNSSLYSQDTSLSAKNVKTNATANLQNSINININSTVIKHNHGSQNSTVDCTTNSTDSSVNDSNSGDNISSGDNSAGSDGNSNNNSESNSGSNSANNSRSRSPSKRKATHNTHSHTHTYSQHAHTLSLVTDSESQSHSPTDSHFCSSGSDSDSPLTPTSSSPSDNSNHNIHHLNNIHHACYLSSPKKKSTTNTSIVTTTPHNLVFSFSI